MVRPEFVETEAERAVADRGPDPFSFSYQMPGYLDGSFTLESGPGGATGKWLKMTQTGLRRQAQRMKTAARKDRRF